MVGRSGSNRHQWESEMENMVRLEGHVAAVRPLGYTARGVAMRAFMLCLHAEGCACARQDREHLRVLISGELATVGATALAKGVRLVVVGSLRVPAHGLAPPEIFANGLERPSAPVLESRDELSLVAA